ncbi:uncharacterized protein PITG_08513 [Phytophthora infestans T30-4]|uniref:Uncharacterized protein n=1 Tax=Phytophthora infestans (strain T30-4) TaxID=403677 RepID=D0NAT2_PHYIT|nr:uncharacterized protein PITG_08513 [Phytophthora infestans T30-4]EEY54940.1 hypothetical protein PITG_08513 [Phytophthora infestans T30-4]|eukprot:XP_002903885.1 hypothetical protein PITG_08513 [Phytophthora infestans T30-4]
MGETELQKLARQCLLRANVFGVGSSSPSASQQELDNKRVAEALYK